MGHFRWIDARKGILEIINGEPKVIFFINMTTTVKLGHGFFKSKVRVVIYNDDGVFRYRDSDDIEVRLVAEDDDAQLLEHYQSWLARVMLAEDIHKSRAEERKGNGEAVRASSERDDGARAGSELSSKQGDGSSANNGDSGRVPLRKNSRNIPVASSERIWKLKPR